MGIQGLWSYLTKNHYDAFKSLSDDLSEYAGQTWVIDVSIYMYKFGTRASFVDEFLDQAGKLRAFGIRPMYVFDGKRHPIKRFEHIRRREQALRSVETSVQRQELLRRLDQEPDADTDTIWRWVSEFGLTDVRKTMTQQSILYVNGADSIELEVHSEQLAAAVREREPRPQIKIPDTHYDTLLLAFEAAAVPFYIAKGDAEKCGAYLCRAGLADALVTDDGDALVFRAPVVVRNLFRGGKCGMEMVRVEELLKKMQLSAAQFVDLAIVCGCDYTESRGLPGFGPAKAVKMLEKYGTLVGYLQSLEWIAKQTMMQFDMARFQYEDATAMFLDDSPQVEYASQALDPAALSVQQMQQQKSN